MEAEGMYRYESMKEVKVLRIRFNVPHCATLFCIFFIFCVLNPTLSFSSENTSLPEDASQTPLHNFPLEAQDSLIKPIRTDSPRNTLASFVRLKEGFKTTFEAYQIQKSKELAAQIILINEKILALLDLSLVAEASRRETGIDTMAYLLDIFERVELPALHTVPGIEDAENDASPSRWRIPGTPLYIARVETGPRQGEFLFSSDTAVSAPRFFQSIQYLPSISSSPLMNWHAIFPQATGPLIPAGIAESIPSGLRELWMGTPVWKIMAIIFLLFFLSALFVLLARFLYGFKLDSTLGDLAFRAAVPGLILLTTINLRSFVAYQINISGEFSIVFDKTMTALHYASVIWLLWIVVLFLFNWIIRLQKIPSDSFNAHLWRFGARILGTLISLVLLGKAAHMLGLPLYSVVAGLGVGGLAVALAIRPTLENLIGGLLLYIDQPVRVGDWCEFGAKSGTVESIGIRSTKIRSLNRTLVTIPNAFLADMELVNWAKCDRMLIESTIGLRYETEIDQLRHILVKIREMFHAHPKIHSETVRVRFTEFGSSSLNFQIRVYALTRDFNEFFAIREDVLMRISDIIKESGSSVAFPSQTLYLGRDPGIDHDRGVAAEKEVEAWRKAGKLPFPRLSEQRIQELEATLDYPPTGSVDKGDPGSEWETEERLSTRAEEENPGSRSPGS